MLRRCILPALLMLAVLPGCQRSNSGTSSVVQQLDPELLVWRGQLCFVRDVAAGCQLARQQQMPCLLFFTAEWCTYCEQMEGEAFADVQVAGLAERFVCVLVDADREPALCRSCGVEGYPTVQFLSADGRKLHRLVGRQSSSTLAAGMRASLERLAWLDAASIRR